MTYSASLRAAMMAGASAVAVIATPAAAQSITFAIPAQGLSGALQQFAVRTNRDLLYSPELVANLRSPGLSGSFTPEDGLRRLLAGTALAFHQPTPNVFVIQRNGPRVASASLQSGMGDAPVEPAAAATGEPSSLTGTVFDGATGTPIAGAAVRIEGTDLSTVTDDRGAYRFPDLAPGDYTIVLDYLGDAPRTETVTIAGGEPATLNFTRRTETGEIVVYGYSSGVQRALNQQRTALNNATIISEDFLGGFPAETVSEALRRIPGVAFGRNDDSGEGSRITVRGFSSELINVQVNGVDLQGTNFERSIDLSGYLAENISTITVHKTLLPSHQSTASGGFVQIETRSGLDYGDLQVSGSIEGESALGDGFGREWQANGTIGMKLTSNFGIAATISYRDTQRTNYDVAALTYVPAVLPVGYTSVPVIPASRQFPFDSAFNNRLIAGANYGARDRDETTLAASLNLAWDIGGHTRLRLDAQTNRRDTSTFITRSLVSYLMTGVEMPIEELGGEVRRRTVFSSLRPTVVLAASDQQLTTNTLSLRGDTDVGRWHFRYKAGYSGARQQSSNDGTTLLGATFTNLTDLIDPSTIVIQRDDDPARTPRVVDGAFILGRGGVPIPSLTPIGLDAMNNPANYSVSNAFRTITNSPTDAWTFEGSARYEAGSWLDYVEAGVRWDRTDRNSADANFATNSVGTLKTLSRFAPIAGRPTTIADIDPGLFVPRSFDDIGIGFTLQGLSAAGNRAFFEALENFLVDDPSTPFNEARFTYLDYAEANPITNPNALAPASSAEQRLAGYVEAGLDLGKFEVVGGVRIEQIRRAGSALSLPSATLPNGSAEPRETFIAAGLLDFFTTSATDITVAPTLLVNYRPRTNIVARFGYQRSTTLPPIQSLRRQPQYVVNLRSNQVIVREGNPDLRPTYVDNFDVDLAYYFQDVPGLIRAGFFYKKTTNNPVNLLIADRPADIRAQVEAFFAPLATTRPDLIAFNADTEFLLARPTNGEGGVIWGVELEAIRRFNFLPGFLSGFGVIANVTYTSGDFPTLVSGRDDAGVLTTFTLDRALQDQAELVYNVSLTYERAGFSGRLSYTHQDLTVSAFEIHDLNTVLPAYSTLDLRLSYNFNAGGGIFTIFLEGDDLLRDSDEPDIRNATASTPGREGEGFFFPNTFQYNGGRTFTLGVRARF